MSTKAEAWREVRRKGFPIKLPEYGDEVLVRPMDAEFFFRSGKVPDFLDQTIQQMINGADYTLPYPESLEKEKTAEWLDWLNELVKFALVSPKVVENPKADDEISIDEIGYPDKLAIYRLFGRPAVVLRKFREIQDKPVATVDVAQNDGDSAQ